MTCIDCGKDAKKVKPATCHGGLTFGYVCYSCWAEWAPFMHPKNCKCGHCMFCRDELNFKWAYGAGPGTLTGDQDL